MRYLMVADRAEQDEVGHGMGAVAHAAGESVRLIGQAVRVELVAHVSAAFPCLSGNRHPGIIHVIDVFHDWYLSTSG